MKSFSVVVEKKINKFNKSIFVEGDKSISHRALLISSQAYGVSKLKGILEAEDVLNTNQMMETEPNLFLSLLGTIASEIDRSSEEKSRRSAMLSAGQYIAASIFYIDLRNNEKKYLMQNETILKLGNPGSLK